MIHVTAYSNDALDQHDKVREEDVETGGKYPVD